jgi:3D-(3,5/4)-trihydroxycyclohexane-1,2-dione acylhydrolase (decyclizing)
VKHRLTVAQAVVRFLANQFTERDGIRHRAVAGFLGIFGHGNVAGVGQALLQAQRAATPAMPYLLARNEQAMVHTAVGYARMRNRLSTMACTTSIGPGATNMLTGAALATVNRIPVLLFPSDVFATRVAPPVLPELEDPRFGDVSVNDAFRPLSKFFDRVWRPEQLPQALLGAMRVLTDPGETGAVTVCLPQDVQAEAYESLGAVVIRCRTVADLAEGLKRARDADRLTVVHIETDPLAAGPGSDSWWDVPVAEVATLHSTRHARTGYLEGKRDQRHHLRPGG